MWRHLHIKLPGSSLRRQGTCFFFLVLQWYAYSSFWKIMTCISSYTHLIMPAAKYKNVYWYSGKIRFMEPKGINGHRRPVPGAPSSGTSRESLAVFGMGPCGYCRRVLLVPCLQGQYSWKICFIEKPGVQDDGVAMWLNVVLTPG